MAADNSAAAPLVQRRAKMRKHVEVNGYEPKAMAPTIVARWAPVTLGMVLGNPITVRQPR